MIYKYIIGSKIHYEAMFVRPAQPRSIWWKYIWKSNYKWKFGKYEMVI